MVRKDMTIADERNRRREYEDERPERFEKENPELQKQLTAQEVIDSAKSHIERAIQLLKLLG